MINHPNRRRKQTRAPVAPATIHDHDADYAIFLSAVRASFDQATAGDVGLFTTSAGDALWPLYLDNLGTERQIHDCHCCREFIKRFGGLVTIDERGGWTSAVWPTVEAIPVFYRDAVLALRAAVKNSRVTGVFLSSQTYLGQPKTGQWTHFAVASRRVFRNALMTPGQAMAAKREDFKTVASALVDFKPQMLSEAMRLLEAASLARSERFIAPVQWLQELQEKRGAAKDSRVRNNLLWRAIASAPDGFCHPRASVVGSLLEDIAAGMAFAEVKIRFDAKMHPLRYQRPQAAPAAGAIADAEKIVEKLGIAPSLERRFARLDECEVAWKPTPVKEATRNSGGVFTHLNPKGTIEVSSLTIPEQTMTWEKFTRVVLPEAESVEMYVPGGNANFMALLTAQHADAPPILKWDRPERRNPVSAYVYHCGSQASSWKLTAGAWCIVTGIVSYPNMWGENPAPFLGDGVLFVLSGAADTRTGQGNALFPETLRGDLHGVRAVIEAYSKGAQIGGVDEASACGLAMSKGQSADYLLRVKSRGQRSDYKIDRWD